MPTAGQVMDMSAALLNDTALSIFTYAAQLPYLNIALRDLGGLLETANVPITNATSAVIAVTAGEDNIGGPDVGDPNLPSGLVEIQRLWQRPTGSTVPYIPIEPKYEFLPQYWADQESNIIPCWAWQEQYIRFFPANTDIDVKIDYIKSAITAVDDATDSIDIIGCHNYLGYRTAALCAKFIGENPTRGQTLDDEAEKEWQLMQGTSTKGRQSIATRRRPFMASWKNRGGY